jgi:hypothetical protein
MSLLQLKENSANTHDASSQGEDYAKGSSYILWTSLIAFVLLSVGITLFLMADRKPPVAAGEVTQAWIHPVHTISRPHDAGGVEAAPEAFDQVLVFAHVRVRNQSKEPIVIKTLMTNATLDGVIHTSYAATATDYDRIFIAYPEIAGLRSNTLTRDTIIQPGQVLDGMMVSAFHASKEQWQTKKDLNFTIDFKMHPSLVLQAPAQIPEQ